MIPVIIIWILVILAVAGGGLLLIGDVRETMGSYIHFLLMAIVIVFVFLPNLPSLIRWTKKVLHEIKR